MTLVKNTDGVVYMFVKYKARSYKTNNVSIGINIEFLSFWISFNITRKTSFWVFSQFILCYTVFWKDEEWDVLRTWIWVPYIGRIGMCYEWIHTLLQRRKNTDKIKRPNSLPGKESSLIMSVNYSVQEIGFTPNSLTVKLINIQIVFPCWNTFYNIGSLGIIMKSNEVTLWV